MWVTRFCWQPIEVHAENWYSVQSIILNYPSKPIHMPMPSPVLLMYWVLMENVVMMMEYSFALLPSWFDTTEITFLPLRPMLSRVLEERNACKVKGMVNNAVQTWGQKWHWNPCIVMFFIIYFGSHWLWVSEEGACQRAPVSTPSTEDSQSWGGGCSLLHRRL